MIQQAAPPEPTPLSEGKAARASSTWGPGYEADKAFDGDDDSRWGAAPTRGAVGWRSISARRRWSGRAVIKELAFPRTQQFAVEYKDGERGSPWSPARRSTARRRLTSRLTARQFRLDILKASEVPTIEEFELFPPAGKESK